MALFDFVKNQFVEVIEWTDSTTNTMVYKFPVRNANIKIGAQLTVRESQAAIFVNEGVVADLFTPGRYELTTQNLPVLTALKSWKFGFNSPFKADIYFVNTKQFTGQKWGTTNPVMMRDSELGVLRLRGFGSIAYRVIDPVVFLKEIFGTSSSFETESISNYLKTLVVSSLSDFLAEMQIPAFDLARHYDEIGDGVRQKLDNRFGAIGLKLTAVLVENISLPPEVEKILDQRTSMSVIGGSLPQYAQYQAAEALRDAARNPGGMAGAGIGLGAGAALGNLMGNMVNAPQQQQGQQPQGQWQGQQGQQPQGQWQGQQQPVQQPQGQEQWQSPPPQQPQPVSSGGAAAQTIRCATCGAQITTPSKFCPECGQAVAQVSNTRTSDAQPTKCGACGASVQPGAKFCPECGGKL